MGVHRPPLLAQAVDRRPTSGKYSAAWWEQGSGRARNNELTNRVDDTDVGICISEPTPEDVEVARQSTP
jgi:hypothetical protein